MKATAAMGFIHRFNIRLDPKKPADVELERLLKRLRPRTRHQKIKDVLRTHLGKPNTETLVEQRCHATPAASVDRRAYAAPSAQTSPMASAALDGSRPPATVPVDDVEAWVREATGVFTRGWSEPT